MFPSISSGQNEEDASILLRAVDAFRDEDIGAEILLQSEPEPSTSRRGFHMPRRSRRGIAREEVAPIAEAIELRARQPCPGDWQIVAKLSARLDARIASNDGRVESASEQSAAISTLFGREQRREPILPIARELE